MDAFELGPSKGIAMRQVPLRVLARATTMQSATATGTPDAAPCDASFRVIATTGVRFVRPPTLAVRVPGWSDALLGDELGLVASFVQNYKNMH